MSFNQHCSGCHTLKPANAYGSKPQGELKPGERTNGPNFNQRKVNRDDALYAIRNGGFSGAIMPANIVTGREADAAGRLPGQVLRPRARVQRQLAGRAPSPAPATA